MKTPSTARAYLLGVANTGREFKHNDVLPDDSTKADLVLGRGHDFTREIEVIDPQGVALLSGQASLCLIGLEKPDGNRDLFMRTRLTWAVGSVGAQDMQIWSNTSPEVDYSGSYLSRAKYVINDRGAERLDEQHRAGTSDDWHASRAYHDAEWNQEYPGDFFESLGVAREPRAYHREAVLAAQKKHPAMLGMLSTSHRGIVQPNELVDIASWVSQNMHSQQG